MCVQNFALYKYFNKQNETTVEIIDISGKSKHLAVFKAHYLASYNYTSLKANHMKDVLVCDLSLHEKVLRYAFHNVGGYKDSFFILPYLIILLITIKQF